MDRFLIVLRSEVNNINQKLDQLRTAQTTMIDNLSSITGKTNAKNLKNNLDKINKRIKDLGEYHKRGVVKDMADAADQIRNNMLNRYLSYVPKQVTRATGALESAIESPNFLSVIAAADTGQNFVNLVGIANIDVLDDLTSLTKKLVLDFASKGFNKKQIDGLIKKSQKYKSQLSNITGNKVAGYWEFQENELVSRHFLLRNRTSIWGEDREVIDKLKDKMVKNSANILFRKDISGGI